MSQSPFCPRYHHAVELLGRRWNGAIIRAILAGRHRYAEIRDAIPGLSDTLLAKRLHELEAEGVLDRRVIPSTPVGVEYHLTEKGAALEPAIVAISAWAESWLPLPPGVEWSPDDDAQTETGGPVPRAGAGPAAPNASAAPGPGSAFLRGS